MRTEGKETAPAKWRRFLLLVACTCLCPLLAGGCATPGLRNAQLGPQPVVGPLTTTAPALAELPPPQRPITVAVYDFPDLTGQRRPGGLVADLSTAVTQGASSLVIESLKSAGGGGWFDVVDRTRDADQARERSIRQAAEPAQGKKPPAAIAPLRPADYILNGGVITYERSVQTSDSTADWLGLGGGAQSNRNFVSVTMRLVNAETSEVVESVTVHKSIDSVAAGIFSKNRAAPFGQYPQSLLNTYPSLSDALDADFSGTIAELTEVALREAIEAAIHDLIIKCQRDGVWDPQRIADHDPVPLPAARPQPHVAVSNVPVRRVPAHPPKITSNEPAALRGTTAYMATGHETALLNIAMLNDDTTRPESFDRRFGDIPDPISASGTGP
jgi:curli production assembly/transport component CsgG